MVESVNKSSGTTSSERFLAFLCNRTFLSLWSYPNIYTDELRHGSIGPSKELCDVLVVFEDNIIIFSDKHVKYNDNIDVSIAWPRWYKKAISSSAKQLFGAERWLRNHPDRIFLDPKCEHPFPLPLNAIRKPRFFRVAVVSGIESSCAKHFGGNSSGSLMLRPSLRGDEHLTEPFVIGNVAPDRGFIHVLDDLSIKAVLGELDTVFDFVYYLKEKEAAFTSSRFDSVSGEEDLLAYYFLHIDYLGRSELDIPIPDKLRRGIKNVILGEGLWRVYVNSDGRRHAKEALSVSYFWDDLIESFSTSILSGTVPIEHEKSISDHEQCVRFLASEGRWARRILANNFLEKLREVPSNARSSRMVPSPTYKNRVYIFLFFPRAAGQSDDEYRQERTSCLAAYGLVAKYKWPIYRYFVLVGTESGSSDTRSEEILVLDMPSLSSLEKKDAKKLMHEMSVLEDNKLQRFGSLFPYRRKGRKVGRNDPCPCGSGKKHKNCCYK